MKIKEFLLEAELNPVKTAEEDDEEGGDDQVVQKIVQLAKIMNRKEDTPKIRKAVKKAIAGKPLTDEDRQYIKDILAMIFRPELSSFIRLLKRF